MKLYAVGKKQNITYGHGSNGEEIHICQKDAYSGDMSFHPLFKTEEDCKEYIEKLKFGYNLFPVELEVNAP
jgi:hypothetical protein